jgi:hypothetical protein
VAIAVRTSRVGRVAPPRLFDDRLMALGAALPGPGRSIAANLFDLLTQPHHRGRIEEHRRRLGPRVGVLALGRVSLKTSYFGVGPMRLMHPGASIIGPQLRLAGIDVNDRHRRRIRIRRGQLPGFELLDLTLLFLPPLAAQPLRDPQDMLVADPQPRQTLQRPCRRRKRTAVRTGELDLGQQRRAVVLAPKIQPLVEQKK